MSEETYKLLQIGWISLTPVVGEVGQGSVRRSGPSLVRFDFIVKLTSLQ